MGKKSGLFSSGSFGVTLGSKERSVDTQNTAQGSTLTAGRDITLQADIAVTAGNSTLSPVLA